MPSNTSADRTSRRRGIAAAAAVLVVALVLGVVSAVATANKDTSGASGGPAATVATPEAQPPSEQDAELLALARRDADDPHAVGRADAPVVMIEYSDFQCPFCGKFARDTKPELMKYVEDGTLRIEWRHFPLFGEESENAARAGYAAAQQDRFWQFHDVVYSEERKRNSGVFAPGKVEKMAREAGVPDIDRFRADMKSKKAGAFVTADSEEGYRLGVTSTPAFLVNSQPILGAQPLETFEAAIESAAKAAQGSGKAAGKDTGEEAAE
ncbi:DsbA family protein [Streptomyces sp. NPDC059506]|uniref:DsbA family protein n=1 Tax=Streptomyces TaxID=1883 RepID=UPI0022AB1E80|nr:thioredoxin domain-containing protein [Streptomyces sp. HB2AG]MCZ2528032.1 thioredoxin domain-containing protein [Streptomyces sp. HB2AG]